MNWSDQRRIDEIHVYMIDPHNLDIVLGELEGVILSESSVSYGYYTDTRVTAKLATLESNYISGAWLRIVAKTGDVERELGTFVLESPPEVREKSGAKVYSYSLQSVLWALSNDIYFANITLNSGCYTFDAFLQLCRIVSKSGVVLSGARNYRYENAKVFEAGETLLSFLFDICDTSNNRLDVDGHGRITIAPYIPPGQITPSWTIDKDDPKTLLLSDEISESVSNDRIPSRTVVIATNGDQEYIGYAERDASSPYSGQARGYTVTEKYQVSDINPASNAQAAVLARKYLAGKNEIRQLKCKMLYFPCRCGEVMYLIRDGVRKKYMIQSIDPLNLEDMNLGLTLREV